MLIDLDGPRLVLAEDPVTTTRYLGLAADEDATFERWVYAPISTMELEALCTGALSMHAAIAKPRVDIVDVSQGAITSIWSVDSADVPDDALPVVDANLPEDIGRLALTELFPDRATNPLASYAFRCEGDPVQEATISFTALARVAASLQVLWSALADATLKGLVSKGSVGAHLDATTLRMADKQAASFGIVIPAPRANDKHFSATASAYRRLVRTPSTKTRSFIQRQPPAVLRSFSAYLKTLDELNIEILAHFGPTSAYIGPAYASLLRPLFKVARSQSIESPTDTSTVTARGYFRAVNAIAKRFIFYDTITGQLMTGDIRAALLKRYQSVGGEFAVGERTLYDVRISRKGRNRPTLETIDETRPTLFSRLTR